ncbi:MAG: SO_0444 family Cu/Zn efflux transporter [Phycisphaerae bacterium]|nr:SO_0444 family Cu/Zn efflux transporter [Phycisphaerae bacterium]
MLKDYIDNLWGLMMELSPWLFIGLAIAGIIHIFMPEGFIKKHLGRRRFTSVLKAVLVGIPMPLCSCGVIPTAMGLKKEGASNGAAAGFLISTPQTGVDSILVSATFLGWPFAIFKVFSALVSGLTGGILVNLFDKEQKTEIKPEKKSCCCSAKQPEPPKPSCCSAEPKNKIDIKEAFRFAFGQLLRDIYRWLIIGILIAAAITTFIPKGSLADYTVTQGIWGMFTMLIISMPMYICATASVPLAASLVIAGMSPGSALVLLMAGPTTNVATMGAILRTFGKRTLMIYLTTVASLSIILGTIFNWVINIEAITEKHVHPMPSVIGNVTAILLTASLVYFIVADLNKKKV